MNGGRGGNVDCPPEIAGDCPFRGCGKRAGGPKRTLDILGSCYQVDCPKAEVEEILKSMDTLYERVGVQGTFKLAFTLPEAKARMALALAVARHSVMSGPRPKKEN
ncbi:MAG: hypothetical protein OEZ32_00980 [Nitrospinota bacterium]|nr:hypothetical protein [Nitrospinota bacterium]